MVLSLGIGEYRAALRQAGAAPASFVAGVSGMGASAVLAIAGVMLGAIWMLR